MAHKVGVNLPCRIQRRLRKVVFLEERPADPFTIGAWAELVIILGTGTRFQCGVALSWLLLVTDAR